MGKKNDNNSGGLSVAGLFLRFVFALALVLLTYNPSGHSAYHWISTAVAESSFGPLHLILVAILLIGWVIYWLATWRALGALGVTLAAILLAGVIWLLFDVGMLKTESVSGATWIVLVALSAVLAVGVSWSHVWRRVTGQINVEDVDD